MIISVRDDSKSETKSGNVWFTDSTRLRESIKETPWALVDGKGPFAVQLPIQDGRKAAGDYMQFSGDQFQPAPDGIVDQVLGQIVGHKQLGIHRTETCLLPGTPLTAVGELVAVKDNHWGFLGRFTDNGKVLVLRKPSKGPFIFSGRSLEELISSAQGASVLCGNAASVLIAIGTGMLLLSEFYAYETRWRAMEAHRRIVEAAGARRAAAAAAAAAAAEARAGNGQQRGRTGVANGVENGGGDGGEEEQRRGVCIVCLERDSDMIFPECGHLCLCRPCVASCGQLDRCPICRERGRPRQVYLT